MKSQIQQEVKLETFSLATMSEGGAFMRPPPSWADNMWRGQEKEL